MTLISTRVRVKDEGRHIVLILTPNYYMGLGRCEWVYAYIGMVDVDTRSG